MGGGGGQSGVQLRGSAESVVAGALSGTAVPGRRDVGKLSGRAAGCHAGAVPGGAACLAEGELRRGKSGRPVGRVNAGGGGRMNNFCFGGEGMNRYCGLFKFDA